MEKENDWESSTHMSIYSPGLTPDDVKAIYNKWDDYEAVS